MNTTKLVALNTTQSAPTSFPCTLHVPPKTDLWVRSPPFDDSPDAPPTTNLIADNQPSFVQAVRLGNFIRASVKVSFKPGVAYDQAGLVLLYKVGNNGRRTKWIKAGLEYYEGEAKRAVVVTPGNSFASDWSLGEHPKRSPKSDSEGTERERGHVKAKVELARGTGSKRAKIIVRIDGEVVREVAWVFGEGQDKDEEVLVGFYAVRPGEDGEEKALEVEFDEWEMETKE
jgi:regulation of enolase protein 1 (concanavalin A-like superfamily)